MTTWQDWWERTPSNCFEISPDNLNSPTNPIRSESFPPKYYLTSPANSDWSMFQARKELILQGCFDGGPNGKECRRRNPRFGLRSGRIRSARPAADHGRPARLGEAGLQEFRRTHRPRPLPQIRPLATSVSCGSLAFQPPVLQHVGQGGVQVVILPE